MIIVKLRGGLGNQLFQYALGRHLAILNQIPLKLDTSLLAKTTQWTYRCFALNAFNIQAAQATPQEIRQLAITVHPAMQQLGSLLGLMPPTYFREPYFHFSPAVLSRRHALYLDGYWQSEKYFADISPILRSELTLRTSFSPRCQLTASMIVNGPSVSMHVRRGDYAISSKANRYLQLTDMDYYRQAVEYMAQIIPHAQFFIFSDDMEWVKAHLFLPFPTHYAEGNTACEDLILMAHCQHHIIANSTFSWWGAWLNPNPHKIVIAPQKWFSTERFNTRDLLPDSWIQL